MREHLPLLGHGRPSPTNVDGADAHGSSCCAPQRAQQSADVRAEPVNAAVARGVHAVEQRSLAAATYRMGDAHGDGNRFDGETPVHDVHVDAFEIDATTVTNHDFAAFVDATGYVTEAESFGYSAVFHLAIAAAADEVLAPVPGAPWWRGVRGADWRHPGGSRSNVLELDDHPVVHVSWNDAMAYCAWTQRRLPTEAEWEYASRGGIDGARYPWGDDLSADEGWRVNIWQGTFPTENTVDDGWLTTAPVRSFAPNGFGLWQTTGNVWEWCSDWFSPDAYRHAPVENPQGPQHGMARVLRGGSYLCHDSYCNRYRNAARSSNTPDSSMGNAGFRTVSLR